MPRWSTAALGVAGSALWILGVYQKETSVCVLPLLAAVVLVGRTRLAGWRRLSAARRRLLGALAAIVLVPLAHVTVEIVRITVRGDLVYDAEVDSGRGVARGLATLWDWTHEVFPPRARQIVLAAIVLTALATLVRRRHNAVAVAALGSGFLTLVFAAQSGVAVSRYYLPAYALALVALSLSLGRLPRLVQVVGVLVAVLAFVPPAGPRDEVSGWAAEEQEGTALVRTVARLESSGCPVAAGGLDLETSMALPVLVRLERGDVRRTCDSGDTYVVVRRYEEGLLLLRACAPGALEPVRRSWIADVYRCTQLRRQPVRHPELGLVEPERLVTMHRLRA